MNKEYEVRIEKLKKLKELGINPFTYDYRPVASFADTKANFREGSEPPQTVSTAGRITSIRGYGKAAFLDIKDRTDKMQIYIKQIY